MGAPDTNLDLHITFSDAAGRYLPSGLSTPDPFQNPAISLQPLMPGDHIRLGGIPNCPWFVIRKRFWDVSAEKVTLTIWLDVPED